MAAILGYAWPGNVRELDHTLERAVLLADDGEIKVADLSLSAGGDHAASLDQMTLEDVERVLVQKALARAGGNVAEAAKALGLSRSALYRRLERFGL
jgi:transcriptional regulator of acetoin/glycerol metabolism